MTVAVVRGVVLKRFRRPIAIPKGLQAMKRQMRCRVIVGVDGIRRSINPTGQGAPRCLGGAPRSSGVLYHPQSIHEPRAPPFFWCAELGNAPRFGLLTMSKGRGSKPPDGPRVSRSLCGGHFQKLHVGNAQGALKHQPLDRARRSAHLLHLGRTALFCLQRPPGSVTVRGKRVSIPPYEREDAFLTRNELLGVQFRRSWR